MKKPLNFSILTLSVLCIFAFYKNANAIDNYGWSKYESMNGLFEVLVPDNYETVQTTLRTDKDKIANHEELIALIDQRPHKNTVKSYIFKLNQTLGPELSQTEMHKIMASEIDAYKRNYLTMNGALIHEIDIYIRGGIGRELYMSYEDPDLGKQSIRAKIMINRTTKAQQIITGPDSVMSAIKTKQFMNSTRLKPGLSYRKGDFKEEWDYHTSPLKTFSIELPPIATPYIMEDPRFVHNQNTEMMRFVIVDPVRAQKIFYNVYGYRTPEPLNFKRAQKLFFNRHLAKFTNTLEGVYIKELSGGSHYGLEAHYDIPGHKKYPFLQEVKQRAFFIQNYMIVQEVLASSILMDTPLVNTLLDLVDFHPEKAEVERLAAEKLKEMSTAPEAKDDSAAPDAEEAPPESADDNG